MSATQAIVGGRVWKKVRLREDKPFDDGGDIDMAWGGSSKLFSFRDALLNLNFETRNMEDEWVTEDLSLEEDNVRKEVMDGVPTISRIEYTGLSMKVCPKLLL